MTPSDQEKLIEKVARAIAEEERTTEWKDESAQIRGLYRRSARAALGNTGISEALEACEYCADLYPGSRAAAAWKKVLWK